MTTPLDVNWARVEQAEKKLQEFFSGWRTKVAAGQEAGTLAGLNRRVVVEVTEEAESRASFNFNEFPFERPHAGELPGFFSMRVSVEGEELRKTHQAIYRENGYLHVYGYYAEMSAIAWEMAREMGAAGVLAAPAGATAAQTAEALGAKVKAEETRWR